MNVLFLCFIAGAMCSSSVTVSRSIGGAGFHYSLDYSLQFLMDATPPSREYPSWCTIGLKQALPKETFVDLYQLDELHRFDSGPKAYQLPINGELSPIDLEKPASHKESREICIMLFKDVQLERKERDTSLVNISFPIHMRYASPSSDGNLYASTSIDLPSVFIHCSDEEGSSSISQREALLDVMGQESIGASDLSVGGWEHLSVSSGIPLQSHVQVPIGQMEDFALVNGGTMIVTMLGTIMVLLVMFVVPRDAHAQ